jgi:hypothetical protein
MNTCKSAIFRWVYEIIVDNGLVLSSSVFLPIPPSRVHKEKFP